MKLPRPVGLQGQSAILLRGQGSFMRDPRCPQHSAFRAKACLGPRPKIFKKPFAAQAPRAFAVYGLFWTKLNPPGGRKALQDVKTQDAAETFPLFFPAG